jgi:2-polyprenyl-6-methoxyphenol hydroxylase-like FAD-dependent oxidoreductase
MAVHARTLEIYAKMDLAEPALALGARSNSADIWANGRWTARIPIGDIGEGLSPFPFVLMLGQDDNERILGAKLATHGVTVDWRTELVALEQHPTHVEATLERPDGTTVRREAAWVAGCDGSKSAVREMNRIGFPGAPYEHTFFVADTEVTGPMKPNGLNVYLWKDGFHLFFPMRGKDRWRVIGILPKGMRQRDDLTFAEIMPAIRREAGADLTFKECRWFSTYRIFHRAAERFRSERCFLLGDAAHIHSPAGGQGMNTGLQDAYNLAWKLALVVQGRADPALLDSYEAERMPVARRLLQTTDRGFRLVVSDSWLAGVFRTRILARIVSRAMTIERVRNLAFRTLSQIAIAYPRSPLSQSSAVLPRGAPAAGERFPWLRLRLRIDGPTEDLFEKLDDTRFNLLVFGQPAPAARDLDNGDLVGVHVVPADCGNDAELTRARIPQPSFYLLRPDGHVGLAGEQFSAAGAKQYLSERLRLGPQDQMAGRDGDHAHDAASPRDFGS